MLRTIFFIILAGIVGLSLFLFGRLAANRPVSYDSGTEPALAGNSLIQRFSPPVEKHAPPSGPVKISNDPGQFLQLAPDLQHILYYLAATGEIRSAALDLTGGQLLKTGLVAQLPARLHSIIWSPTAQELLADSGGGWTYYNLKTGRSRALDSKVRRPIWSPDGTHLAYLWLNPAATSYVSVADPSGEIFKNLLAVHDSNWQIGWLDNQTLVVSLNGFRYALTLANGWLERLPADAPTAPSVLTAPTVIIDGRNYSIYSNPTDGKIYVAPTGVVPPMESPAPAPVE